jgi:hypothetical protein
MPYLGQIKYLDFGHLLVNFNSFSPKSYSICQWLMANSQWIFILLTFDKQRLSFTKVQKMKKATCLAVIRLFWEAREND